MLDALCGKLAGGANGSRVSGFASFLYTLRTVSRSLVRIFQRGVVISSVHSEPITAGKPRRGAQHHGHQDMGVKPQKFQCTPCPSKAHWTVVRILQVPTKATGSRAVGQWPLWRLRSNLQKRSGLCPTLLWGYWWQWEGMCGVPTDTGHVLAAAECALVQATCAPAPSTSHQKPKERPVLWFYL